MEFGLSFNVFFWCAHCIGEMPSSFQSHFLSLLFTFGESGVILHYWMSLLLKRESLLLSQFVSIKESVHLVFEWSFIGKVVGPNITPLQFAAS